MGACRPRGGEPGTARRIPREARQGHRRPATLRRHHDGKPVGAIRGMPPGDAGGHHLQDRDIRELPRVQELPANDTRGVVTPRTFMFSFCQPAGRQVVKACRPASFLPAPRRRVGNMGTYRFHRHFPTKPTLSHTLIISELQTVNFPTIFPQTHTSTHTKGLLPTLFPHFPQISHIQETPILLNIRHLYTCGCLWVMWEALIYIREYLENIPHIHGKFRIFVDIIE